MNNWFNSLKNSRNFDEFLSNSKKTELKNILDNYNDVIKLEDYEEYINKANRDFLRQLQVHNWEVYSREIREFLESRKKQKEHEILVAEQSEIHPDFSDRLYKN